MVSERIRKTAGRNANASFRRTVACLALASSPAVACAQLSGVNDLLFEESPGGCKALQGNAIAAAGQACCTANELCCAGHAQKLVLYCDPVKLVWEALQSCSGQMLCDTKLGTTQGSCQDPVPVCVGKQPGDRVCEGNAVTTCGADLVSSTEETCDHACADGACQGSCVAGARRCDGERRPQVCTSKGDWQDEADCPFVCVGEGMCTGVCKPGDQQCFGNQTRLCGADGQWQDGATCPKLCVKGACADSCTDGDKQCSGLAPQTCTANAWQNEPACKFLCKDGACGGACSPGDQSCEGAVPRTCDATGQWQSASACEYVCEIGQCSGECLPGDKGCLGLAPRHCDVAGRWTALPPCANVCNQGVCTGVCPPGTKQCAGNVPQQCDTQGQWQDGAPCADTCSAGSCVTGGCVADTRQCNGPVLQSCVNGSWTDETTCAYACSAGACSGECKPGGLQCNGTTPQTCNASGEWQSGSACPFACKDGGCVGVCTPGQKSCLDSTTPMLCQSDGTWQTQASCATSAPLCSEGICGSNAPSCAGLSPCPGAKSCCESVLVPGGTYNRENDPAFPATVSDFRLDLFEVTVGRMRNFVAGYPGNQPAAGAGKNPHNPADTGWKQEWLVNLHETQAALKTSFKCDGSLHTWTDSPSTKESHPINCVDWYTAFAFCIWDGGRLPTYAELSYATVGGAEQRYYPWSDPPTAQELDATYVVYNYDPLLAVGSKSTKGNGRWGHRDLLGNVSEWAIDKGGTPPTPCIDCALLGAADYNVNCGGSFWCGEPDLTASGMPPQVRTSGAGLRCIRD